MSELEGRISRKGGGTKLSVLGQEYYLKASCESTFALEGNPKPGQFVPVHIHPTQDEFIFIQDGELDVKLDGVWSTAKPGDLVFMPKGVPHGYFNRSNRPARGLFWVSPAGELSELFEELHNETDIDVVTKISAEYGMDFLPPEANE